MAPGQETVLKKVARIVSLPFKKLAHFFRKTLRVSFCYRNSLRSVCRAWGLVSFAICVICGFIALFFGTLHAIQGAVSICLGVMTLIFEFPFFPRLCSPIRRQVMYKAFAYMLLSLPLFLSWYTLFAGIAMLSLAGMYLYSIYIPSSPEEDEFDTDGEYEVANAQKRRKHKDGHDSSSASESEEVEIP